MKETEEMIFTKIEDSFNKSGCNYILAGTDLAVPFAKRLGLKKSIPFRVHTEPCEDIFTIYKVYVINILGEDKKIFPQFGAVAIYLS